MNREEVVQALVVLLRDFESQVGRCHVSEVHVVFETNASAEATLRLANDEEAREALRRIRSAT